MRIPKATTARIMRRDVSLPASPSQTPFVFWKGIRRLTRVVIRHLIIVSQRIKLPGHLDRPVEERVAELLSEREFLAALLEAMDEGVVACDAAGVLTVFNDASRRMHGLPAEPIPAEMWAEHYSLREPDGVTPLGTDQIPLLRALRGEHVRSEEIVVAPRHGRQRLLSCNGRAIVGPGGAQLGAVVALHDITDQRRDRLALEHQAFHDGLTGLGNRALFDVEVTAILARTPAEQTSLTVVLVGLDDFKRVNASLGYVVGDLLLVEVSHRLRSCVSDPVLAVRVGGDAFVFMLADSTPADAVAVARRMLDVLTRPVAVGGGEILVGASIGIVCDSDRRNPSQLLSGAHLAMYEAKRKRKGGFIVFDPAMQALADRRLTMEREMREGLRDGDFRLEYQPVVSLSTGAVTGVEALLRWDCPGRGTVMPDDFIPVAEQTGLIVPLGQWVLAEACDQLVRWDSLSPRSRLAMAVNVSLRQLDRPGFVEAVKTVLDSTGLAPDRLVLEITETALRDDESTAVLLRELHDVGVRLSIDDFGTGYSSLARLRTSSVDYVKLDRSFVAEIDGTGNQVPMVEAIVAMARGLGLRTIGEGIETPEQFAYLARLHCDESQGNLMSSPVPPEGIAELLATTPWRSVLAGGLVDCPELADPTSLQETAL